MIKVLHTYRYDKAFKVCGRSSTSAGSESVAWCACFVQGHAVADDPHERSESLEELKMAQLIVLKLEVKVWPCNFK